MTRGHRFRFVIAVAAAAVSLSAFLAVSSAEGEQGQVHLESSRVRVTVAGRSTSVIGTVMRLEGGTLYLARGASYVPVPVATITHLEASRGRSARTGRGIVLGALIGAGTGAFLGVVETGDSGDSAGDRAVMGATNWAILGVVVGAIAGTFSHKERWETVPLEQLAPMQATAPSDATETQRPAP